MKTECKKEEDKETPYSGVSVIMCLCVGGLIQLWNHIMFGSHIHFIALLMHSHLLLRL